MSFYAWYNGPLVLWAASSPVLALILYIAVYAALRLTGCATASYSQGGWEIQWQFESAGIHGVVEWSYFQVRWFEAERLCPIYCEEPTGG
jgi:hypothetical protein